MPYAIAKIAGIKLCEAYNRQYGVNYRSVMPTNLYGPRDNFHPENSHVIPALMQRFHKAKLEQSPTITIWGSGKPKREFLHVQDMAQASLFVMNLSEEEYLSCTQPTLSHINVGTGKDISIIELAQLLAKVTAYEGELLFDASRLDGSPRKLLDVSCLQEIGWKHQIKLKTGLENTYQWYLNNYGKFCV